MPHVLNLGFLDLFGPHSFRDGREKFIRRFHALKLAPTLSLGMVDVRRVDRASGGVDEEKKKVTSKQEW